MKTSSIIDLSIFKDITKINILSIPNQQFTTTINQIAYDILIETSTSGDSFISIYTQGRCLCRNGNIKSFVDLTLSYKNGSFFFVVDIDKQYIDLNYSNFGKGLYLYYGSI